MIGLDQLKKKNLHGWAGGYLKWMAQSAVPRARAALEASVGAGLGLGNGGPRHLMFAFCDHYEPHWKNTDHARGSARVREWLHRYPTLVGPYRDSDGRPPRHSFFFPGEEYTEDYLDGLASLARRGFGEVELHLHHHDDTADNLRRTIADYLRRFAGHGHLSRDRAGRLRYAFIHGNWCLANARRDRRWCGVDEELPLLFDSGCYADFTFPAAPDDSQPPIVNQIYWPEGDLARRRAQDTGSPARVGEVRRDRILMVEGPLAFTLRPGPVPRPRIENSAVTADDPATPTRVRSWVRQGIHVAGRPEWVFVKVHTHGAPEKQAASLLGDGGRMMHTELTTRYNDGLRWRLHYVTAREMFNIAIAAMDGKTGDPGEYRDYELPPPPVATAG